MTTPAKNETVNTSKFSRKKTYVNNVLTQDIDLAYNLQTAFHDQRPASGNAPRIRGFKLCRVWDHSGWRYSSASSTCEVHGTGNPGTRIVISGNIWDWQPPAAQAPSGNMKNKCLVKALNKLKDQEIHLGNFAAEAHKTFAMVASNARTIAELVLRFRRNFPKDFEFVRQYQGVLPRHRWCELPRRWLELQYGWRPLMSDIMGSMRHLQKRGRFNLPYVTVRASVSDRVTTEMGATNGYVTRAVTLNHEQAVHTTLIYGAEGPQLAELSSLGLVNPAEIIWEILPYSFVVDWFLPIGPWLSSLTGDIGYHFISGCQSSKATCTTAGSRISSTYPGYTIDNPGEFKLNGKGETFVRSIYGSAPFPGLYVKNPLSLEHVANALALMLTAFRLR